MPTTTSATAGPVPATPRAAFIAIRTSTAIGTAAAISSHSVRKRPVPNARSSMAITPTATSPGPYRARGRPACSGASCQ